MQTKSEGNGSTRHSRRGVLAGAVGTAAVTLARPSVAGYGSGRSDYFPPPDSDGGWRTLKDAAGVRKRAGMDLRRLENAFEFTSRCSQNGGLLVVRKGYLVFEKYFG